MKIQVIITKIYVIKSPARPDLLPVVFTGLQSPVDTVVNEFI